MDRTYTTIRVMLVGLDRRADQTRTFLALGHLSAIGFGRSLPSNDSESNLSAYNRPHHTLPPDETQATLVAIYKLSSLQQRQRPVRTTTTAGGSSTATVVHARLGHSRGGGAHRRGRQQVDNTILFWNDDWTDDGCFDSRSEPWWLPDEQSSRDTISCIISQCRRCRDHR
jgi:hypothetical protein